MQTVQNGGSEAEGLKRLQEVMVAIVVTVKEKENK